MESTALVLAERPVDVPAELSPIGQMIVILESRHAGELATTHFGAARWSGLPIRLVLADAAALVIDAVGKRRERTAQTLIDAKKIAEQTEARLNVGLLLLHGSSENAAIAFEQTMRDAIAAAAKEYRAREPSNPPMDAASVWTRPAYLFLVACVKRGREEGERLRVVVDRLEERNIRAGRGRKICDGLESTSISVSYLEANATTLDARECAMYASFPSELVAYEAILETGIRAVRPDIERQGRNLPEYAHSLFAVWIWTAVLKVALGNADVTPGAISHSDAFKAQARLRELDLEQVAEAVADVALKRSWSLPERQRETAKEYVWKQAFAHAKFLARAKHGHGPSPGEHFIDQDLQNDSQIVLTHEAALRYLGHDESVGDEYEDYPPETILAIENGLDWGWFDIEEFDLAFGRARLPTDVIIRHLADMQTATRDHAVAWILEGHPERIKDLVAGGHLPWSAEIGKTYGAHLPPELLVRSLRERLEAEEEFYGQVADYVGLMIRVPLEALEEIWNDPRLHGQIVEFVRSLLFEDHVPHGATKDEAELIARVGDRFDRYAMEAYACMRGNDYGDPMATAKELGYLDWGDSSRNEGMTQDLRRLLGPRLPALLAASTEEECYARVVARRPNAKKLVAEFVRNRDRFYGKK
ncbi:MAG: hypothetical protein WCO25_04630 [Candidatus Uhrbacteria bacterium]